MTERKDCKRYYLSLTQIQDGKHYLHMSLTKNDFLSTTAEHIFDKASVTQAAFECDENWRAR